MLHKRFDFTQLGGFPLTQERLAFMQEAYGDLVAVLISIVGDNVILSGMEEDGTNLTNGWLIYNGDLLPYKRSENTGYFQVVEEFSALTFEDGVQKQVQSSKFALSASSGIAVSSLIRLSALLSQQHTVTQHTDALAALSSSLSSQQVVISGHSSDLAELFAFMDAYNSNYQTASGSTWKSRFKIIGNMLEISILFIRTGLDIPKRLGLPGVPATITSHFDNVVAMSSDGTDIRPAVVSFLETTEGRALVQLYAEGADPSKTYYITLSSNIPILQ